jgi:hypothetical protein
MPSNADLAIEATTAQRRPEMFLQSKEGAAATTNHNV